MKLGGAFYCDECGAEISCGDYCSECRPGEGVEQVTYTFLAYEPEDGTVLDNIPSSAEKDKPWWKLW